MGRASQGNWSQAVTLTADLSCPVSQEDLGSDWQPPYSLAGDAVSGAKIAAAPLPSTSDYHVPASLPLKEKEKKEDRKSVV